MATHKSAAKRARQAPKRTARNKQTLGTVRTTEKKLRIALTAGDKTAAQALLQEYTSKTMKAAVKGVMHAKTASRKIGQLSGLVSKK